MDGSIDNTIAANLAAVRARISAACARAARDAASVRLICVTKQRPLPFLEALRALGEPAFGENRIQDARDRIPQFPAGIEWHMIGHLQTNKAKYVPGLFQWVHSVDSVELAQALGSAMERRAPGQRLNVLVQVNIAGEEQKHGSAPQDARRIAEAAAAQPALDLRGLMAMAPFADDPEEARPTFRGLRLVRDQLAAELGIALPELSMGMTNDFEAAIEEGATMVRIGSALFEGLE